MFDLDHIESFEDIEEVEELSFFNLFKNEQPDKIIISNAKLLLEQQYPNLYYEAKFLKEPSMVTNYKIDNIPSTTKSHSDKVSDAVERKEVANYEIAQILNAIEKIYLPKKSQPNQYYKRLLWLRYIEPKNWKLSTAEICIQLAKEFPARLDDKEKFNPYFMDMHVYSKDLRDALLAFSRGYKNRILCKVDLCKYQ